MKHLPLLLLLLLTACAETPDNPKEKPQLQTGIWRMELGLSPEINLPFLFEIIDSNGIFYADIINGTEKIRTERFSINSDSVNIPLPIFDSEFRLKKSGDSLLSGTWYQYSRGEEYNISSQAFYGRKDRFPAGKESPLNVNGKWKAIFSQGTENEYPAVGLFEQKGDIVTGTFLTETGDYRFLEGRMAGDRLQLSCFDGSHAFLFDATLNKEGVLNGVFYSGNHWKEPWVATLNDTFELADPETLTFIKEGYSGLEFSFPDLDKNTIKFPSEEYNGKVVIVELMGSWCPNCMDETNYLKTLYEAYHPKGLEIISLCYERSEDFDSSVKNVRKHKEQLGADWRFLIAGSAQKEKAAATLPMLNHVMSFPTTIFIDKTGKVRKIYTGFYGPGTGQYHARYAEMNRSFIEKLLEE